LFIVITFLWIFFRAENISHAVQYISGIFSARGGDNSIGINHLELALALFLAAVMMWREYFFPAHFIRSRKAYACYVTGMVLVCYVLGVFEENQFIYFQF
jgi:alginate O-acetyltransferase complex protein AlgI